MKTTSHPWELIFRREGRVFTEPFAGFKDAAEKFNQYQCHRILDLGCGNGRHVVALEKEGFNAVGLDISKSGLRLTNEWLREEDLPAELIRADMRRCLPFKNNSFDGLLSTQVIHHALLSEIRITITEIWRILSDPGIAFVTVPSRKNLNKRSKEVESDTFVPLEGIEKGLPHHLFSDGELLSEFGTFQILELCRRDEGKVLALWLMKVK